MKCEHPDHLFKATNQSEFCFKIFVNLFPQFQSQKGVAKRYLRLAEFNCSKKLQNIFEIALRKFKCEVMEQKLLLEK